MPDQRPAGPAKGVGHGGRARGYSWEPFEEGNTAALTHGAWSERRIGPLGAAKRSELLDIAPWLEAPGFGDAVAALTRSEARIALVDSFLEENGVLDEMGKPRPAVDLLVRLERLAMDQRSRLGLDPKSAAGIGKDLLGSAAAAVHLERLAARGRQVRTASEHLNAPEDIA